MYFILFNYNKKKGSQKIPFSIKKYANVRLIILW